MNYKSALTQKNTPNRLTRKQARRGIYVYNVSLKAKAKKAERLARQAEQGE
jgi:hypothetical protein